MVSASATMPANNVPIVRSKCNITAQFTYLLPTALAPPIGRRLNSLEFPAVSTSIGDGWYRPLAYLILELRHHPGGLQHRISDQTHDRGCGDQERVADFPAKQDGERDQTDQGREPV